MSFQVSAHFKALFEVATVRQNLSQTFMLEAIPRAYCGQHCLDEQRSRSAKAKGGENE